MDWKKLMEEVDQAKPKGTKIEVLRKIASTPVQVVTKKCKICRAEIKKCCC